MAGKKYTNTIQAEWNAIQQSTSIPEILQFAFRMMTAASDAQMKMQITVLELERDALRVAGDADPNDNAALKLALAKVEGIERAIELMKRRVI